MTFDSKVIPTFPMEDPYPGLFPGPQREVWACSSTHPALATNRAVAQVWAAPSTFSSADTRKAAGIWVLDWSLSYPNGSLADPNTCSWGVTLAATDDPGPGAVPGVLSAIGGQDIATLAILADQANQRAPRSQYSSTTISGAFAGLTTNWPASDGGNRNTSRTVPYPVYVPPGQQFHLTMNDLNVTAAIGIVWVEAEEKPTQQPPPVPTA